MEAVYSITNTANDRIYIGRSRDIEKRWRSHKGSLLNNSHINKELQSDFNQYGESNFIFKIEKETKESERYESIIYYKLLDSGAELYNKGRLIDYRVLSTEEAISIGEKLVEKVVSLLSQNSLNRYELKFSEINTDRTNNELRVALSEYLRSERSSRLNYTVTLRIDSISFINTEEINNAMDSFSL